MKKPSVADDIPRELWDAAFAFRLSRLLELPGQGFGTYLAYDTGFLRSQARRRGTFILQPTHTRDKYGIAVDRNAAITDNSCHALWVMYNGKVLKIEDWRRLTLTRGERCQIVVVSGWR